MNKPHTTMIKLEKTLNIKYFLPVLLLGLMVSCTDNPSGDDDEGPGEEELITQVNISLQSDEAPTVTASWSDEDGPGGNDPVIGTLQLQAGTTYSGTIELLNTTESPAEDISQEVREEGDEHQFFYTLSGSGASRITIDYDDQDENGLPVGLQYTVTVSGGDAVNATLNVVLSHYDDSPKNGIDRSDETDIDIDIPVEIQNP